MNLTSGSRQFRADGSVGVECDAGLGPWTPGKNAQAVAWDHAGDCLEIGADDRRIHSAAVAPEPQVAELFQITSDVVQRLAPWRPPPVSCRSFARSRAIERVDLAQAKLKRPKDALAVVELGWTPVGCGVLSDQWREAVPVRSKQDKPLSRPRDRRRFGEDLAAAMVADDQVFLADDNDQ